MINFYIDIKTTEDKVSSIVSKIHGFMYSESRKYIFALDFPHHNGFNSIGNVVRVFSSKDNIKELLENDKFSSALKMLAVVTEIKEVPEYTVCVANIRNRQCDRFSENIHRETFPKINIRNANKNFNLHIERFVVDNECVSENNFSSYGLCRKDSSGNAVSAVPLIV